MWPAAARRRPKARRASPRFNRPRAIALRADFANSSVAPGQAPPARRHSTPDTRHPTPDTTLGLTTIMAIPTLDPNAPAFTRRYLNLADPRLGAKALFATDEFFSPKESMLDPQPATLLPG